MRLKLEIVNNSREGSDLVGGLSTLPVSDHNSVVGPIK